MKTAFRAWTIPAVSSIEYLMHLHQQMVDEGPHFLRERKIHTINFARPESFVHQRSRFKSEIELWYLCHL